MGKVLNISGVTLTGPRGCLKNRMLERGVRHSLALVVTNKDSENVICAGHNVLLNMHC